jgi:hypothetical protein
MNALREMPPGRLGVKVVDAATRGVLLGEAARAVSPALVGSGARAGAHARVPMCAALQARQQACLVCRLPRALSLLESSGKPI